MKMMNAEVQVESSSHLEEELTELYPEVFTDSLGHSAKEKADLLLSQDFYRVFRCSLPIGHAAIETLIWNLIDSSK